MTVAGAASRSECDHLGRGVGRPGPINDKRGVTDGRRRLAPQSETLFLVPHQFVFSDFLPSFKIVMVNLYLKIYLRFEVCHFDTVYSSHY